MHPPLPSLILALLAPGRHPDPAPRVEPAEPHISWVLLAAL